MAKCKVKILPRAWETLRIIKDLPDVDVHIPDKWFNQLGYRIYVISQTYVATIKLVDVTIYLSNG